MHSLIVKTGALGDVVRTSYFAKSLKDTFGSSLRLSWFTAPASADLLRLNPHIDDLWFEFTHAKPFRFDRIYSLDDERSIIDGVMGLDSAALTGAVLQAGSPAYTNDAAEWFDMGLISRLGKLRADELKKANRRSHAEIFRSMFKVAEVKPHFYLDEGCRAWAQDQLPGGGSARIGINPYSGGRWPSKELRPPELRRLIASLLGGPGPFGTEPNIILIGAGPDYSRNLALAAELNSRRVAAVCTDKSVQHLAAVVGGLDYLITSDSLALHLAVAQNVPFTAFFSPTSAAEIDDWGIGTKLISTADDYCSYRKDADNTSITAERILEAVAKNPRIRPGRAP
jgi:heptosyltransferase II